MKKHYREVVFLDTQTGKKFLTRSTAETREVIKWENGYEYPLVKIEISSDSHPAYTGKVLRTADTTGRIEAFNKRYAKAKA